MVINWAFHSLLRITCECDISECVYKLIDSYRKMLMQRSSVSTIGLHISNWKCTLQVNRMRMRSPSSTHCALFVIALTPLRSAATNPFLRFIYRYCLFPVTVDYHLLLSKINCSFLLWEKNQLGKANRCLSQRCGVENEWRRRTHRHQYQQQQQKRDSCNCFLITHRMNNKRKKHMNLPRRCALAEVMWGAFQIIVFHS